MNERNRCRMEKIAAHFLLSESVPFSSLLTSLSDHLYFYVCMYIYIYLCTYIYIFFLAYSDAPAGTCFTHSGIIREFLSTKTFIHTFSLCRAGTGRRFERFYKGKKKERRRRRSYSVISSPFSSVSSWRRDDLWPRGILVSILLKRGRACSLYRLWHTSIRGLETVTVAQERKEKD